MGLGKIYLKTKHLASLGPAGLIFYARRLPGLLRSIERLSPMPCAAEPAFQIHMLLSAKFFWMGLWTLCSFKVFAGQARFGIVVHDDGSLTDRHAALIARLFPGCEVIRRDEADRRMKVFFARNGLRYCERLRDGLIFALKLFDVCALSSHQDVLLLDCDVLFFRRPDILLEPFSNNLFMEDLNPVTCYSVPEARIDALAGARVPRRLNPGIIRFKTDQIHFDRMESCLKNEDFWDAKGRPKYYSELTLWAMEFSHGKYDYLKREYGFVYSDPAQTLTACHYCGTFRTKTVDYGRALERLLRTPSFTGALDAGGPR